MSKVYAQNKISYLASYTLEDIANVFNITVRTAKDWIKAGLKPIDDKKPALFYGNTIKEFLNTWNSRHKTEIAFEEFFCLSCKNGKRPYHNQIAGELKSGQFIATAICPVCKHKMRRVYSQEQYSDLKKFYQVVEMSSLYDSDTSQSKQPKIDNKEGKLI